MELTRQRLSPGLPFAPRQTSLGQKDPFSVHGGPSPGAPCHLGFALTLCWNKVSPAFPFLRQGQPLPSPRSWDGIRSDAATFLSHLLHCLATLPARHFLTFSRREPLGPGRLGNLCQKNKAANQILEGPAVSHFKLKAFVPKDSTVLAQRRKTPTNPGYRWAIEGPGPFSSCEQQKYVCCAEF